VPRPYWDWWPCIWHLPPEQLDWLAADLAAHREMPTVLVNHPLSVPLSARLTGREAIHLPPAEPLAELDRVVASHPQVILQLGGHAHAQQIERRRGIVHVACGAVSEPPYTYRVVRVEADALTVETRDWPARDAEMLDPDTWAQPWVAGRAEDQGCRVPWPPCVNA